MQNSTVREEDRSRLIEVKTIDLAGLLKSFTIERCDYLKIDCEGGEYDLLFNTPAETLKRVLHICMEVHDGMTAHNRQEMISFLEGQGYETRLTPNPVHGDLVYLYAKRK